MNHRPFFFGYGSLVNRLTHAYPDAQPAQLTGWRRIWRKTTARDVMFLSAEPCDGATIAGLVAHVPDGDWTALDAREWAYQRQSVRPEVPADVNAADFATYSVPAAAFDPQARGVILLSYLDVVVQGYLREFGTAGATAFFESTAGWDAMIEDDRAAPRYPRAQRLSRDEIAFVDDALSKLGKKP